MSFWIKGLLLGAMLAWPMWAGAAQLHYKTHIKSGKYHFAYVYVGHDGKKRDIAFYMPKAAVADARKTYQTPSFKDLNAYVHQQGYAEFEDFVAKHNRPMTQAELDTLLHGLKKDYFAQNMLLLRPQGQLEIDYTTIAKRYIDDMAPVARAFMQTGRTSNVRSYVSEVLAFLQSIPYDTLLDNPGQFSFTPPPNLFALNKGDCDVKTVALMSIVQQRFPHVPLAIIRTPQHAFLGLGIPRKSSDETLKIDGRTYVLTEPTGPALLPVGQTAPTSRANLDAGKYYYVKF